MERWHENIFLHKTVQGCGFRLGKSKWLYWFNLKCRFTCLLQRNIFPAHLISFRPTSSRCRRAGITPPPLAPDLLALHLASEIVWLMSARVMSALVSLWSFPPATFQPFHKIEFWSLLSHSFNFSSHLLLYHYAVSLASVLFSYTV